MKKTIIWLVVAISLVLIGFAVFCATLCFADWDFNKLDTGKYQTKTYQITQDFNNITIDINSADIKILPSNQGCTITCFEEEKQTHTVTAQSQTLTIKVNDSRKFYDYIGFNLKSPSITIYLPNTTYSSLTINSDTGDISISKDFSFDSVDISLDTGDVSFCATSNSTKIKTSTGDVSIKDTNIALLDICTSTGDINLTNLYCDTLSTAQTTGDSYLENVNSKTIRISTDTGDVVFNHCDASELIDVSTNTGDVEGSFLSPKIFDITTSTGDKDVPQSTSGALCKINTDTGDIEITIAN